MERTNLGTEIYATVHGAAFRGAGLGAFAHCCDFYVSETMKDIVLFFCVSRWLLLKQTTHPPTSLRSCLFAGFIFYASIVFALYASMTDRGTAKVLGGLLLDRLLSRLVTYLKTDGPLGVEFVEYNNEKSVAYSYIGAFIVLRYASKMLHLPVRLLSALQHVLVPIACTAAVFGAYLALDLKLNSGKSSKHLMKSLLARVSLYYMTGISFAFDKWERVNALALHWLNGIVRAVGEWIDEQRTFFHEAEDYEHDGLDEFANARSIRLLRLSRRGIFSGFIKAELKPYLFEQVPHYEALSYTWGTPQMTKLILINKKKFWVTESAHGLLHARSSIWRDRLVWIDSICIDQRNDKEKTSQVQIMGEIYKKAARVIVWPGDDCYSCLASAMLYDIFGTSYAYQGSGLDTYYWYFNERYSASWLALVKLFRKDYFTRVWVAQEVSVASSVEIYHGGVYIPWEIFMDVLIGCQNAQGRVLLSYTSTPGKRVWRLSGGIGNSSVMTRIRENIDKAISMDLGQLLMYCIHFKSTDPRDKVYALLGLTTQKVRDCIRPKYESSATVEAVYTLAAHYALSQPNSSLVMLGHAGLGSPRRFQSLPSWAPDWTTERKTYSLNASFDKGLEYQTYQGFPPAEIRFDSDDIPRILSVGGIVVDSISISSKEFDVDADAEQEVDILDIGRKKYLWHQKAWEIAQNARDPYPKDGQSRDEAFWRTLTGDRDNSKRPLPLEFGRYHSVWAESMEIFSSDDYRAEARRAREGKALASGLTWGPSPVPSDPVLHAGMRDYDAAALDASYGRAFCVTERGNMGLAPPRARQGDLVCVLFGAATPFLLRRYVDTKGKYGAEGLLYQLVGECYIHGMMDGKAKMDPRYVQQGKQEVFKIV
jgi:hypothetical protein